MHIIYYNKVRTQQCNIFDISTCRIEDFMGGSLQPLFFILENTLFQVKRNLISKKYLRKFT